MLWSIRNKLFLGFGVTLVVLVIVGLVGIVEMNKTKHFADVEMVKAINASDGAMESRINYLSGIWGILDAATNPDEQSQKEGLKRLADAKIGFVDTIKMLEGSGIVTEDMLTG